MCKPPTLIVPHLPVHILGQPAHMREIEHHPVEPPLSDLPAPRASSSFSQFRSIDAIEDLDIHLIILASSVLELPDKVRRLRVLLRERGDAVIACCYHGVATMVVVEGTGE